jgi:hypothetical protein
MYLVLWQVKPRLISLEVLFIYDLFNATFSSLNFENKALNITVNCEKLNSKYVARRTKEVLELVDAIFQYSLEVLRKYMK